MFGNAHIQRHWPWKYRVSLCLFAEIQYVQHSESNFKTLSDSFSKINWKKFLPRGSLERQNYITFEGAEHQRSSFTSGETVSEIWRWHAVFLLLWRKCQRQMDGVRMIVFIHCLFRVFFPLTSRVKTDLKARITPETTRLGVLASTPQSDLQGKKREKNTLWQKLEVPSILW